MVEFLQCRCIRLKWLYSGTSGCIRASGFIRDKGVVFGQKWLYSGKVVVFGQKWLYSDKVVVVGQKLYSCKVVVLGQKGLYSEKLL